MEHGWHGPQIWTGDTQHNLDLKIEMGWQPRITKWEQIWDKKKQAHKPKYFRDRKTSFKNKTYLMPFVLMIISLLLWIPTVRAGTLTGSVSFTPTTIRVTSTYTFELTNSRLLEANEVSD